MAHEKDLLESKDWFFEQFFFKNYAAGFRVKEILHNEDSKFQNIKVLDTHAVGKLLLLDNKTMVSQIDEFVYHEVVSHIPYMVHPNAKDILIIGGGDGGVVREFVKHEDLRSIHLVEIDERVIEVSKKFFPECTSGLSDKRVHIHHEDGIEFIKNHEDAFDIIVVDSTDPEDFAEGLFTSEFYGNVNQALRSDGIMINQTENPFYDEFDVRKIYDNLRESFPIVQSYAAPMMIYPGSYWSFGFSSKKYSPKNLVEHKVSKMNEIQKNLKWYNQNWHQGCFNLSNFHAKKTGIQRN